MKKIAIMQPTYLPWLGFFGLMRSVDIFIILDSVQFAKRSWQQRNQIKTIDGPKWITVPVFSKGKREQLISEVLIDYTRDYPNNHIKTLEQHYKKTPYFELFSPDIFKIMQINYKHLSDLTINQIKWIKNSLDISTPIYLASEFDVNGTKADLLLSLCEKVNATHYISPPGSKIYLEKSNAFSDAGIEVNYFQFSHIEYPQLYGDFLPYMSILDLLFNCGREIGQEIIQNGSKIISNDL